MARAKPTPPKPVGTADDEPGRNAASGVVALEGRHEVAQPLIFGNVEQQRLLLQLHREGRVRRMSEAPSGLVHAGLVVHFKSDHRRRWNALDPRHPAANELKDLLSELSGEPGVPAELPDVLPPVNINHERALGHYSRAAFRVLLQILVADAPLNRDALRERLPDIWRSAVDACIGRFIRDRVLEREGGGNLHLAPGVPKNLAAFILRTAEGFASEDPRFAERPTVTKRPTAFMSASDGAARLFGTDLRLRNFMALAVHGPMLVRELRRITGAMHLHLEDRWNAQFGRGAILRVWDTDQGPAVMLDPDYPLHLPLRRLLVALERTYPLPVYVPEVEPPELPERQPWHGDRHALFGGIIPTTILASIGVHGWTFEALCCVLLSKSKDNRFNVKHAMRRLEDEKVIQGSRPRGPGFNVRVVTVADDFPAKAELEALLRAYVEAWPNMADAVHRGFEKIARERPRGKVHLVKRGLWPY